MWPTLRSTTINLPVSSIQIHRFTIVEKIEKQSDMFCNIANISQKELPLPVVGCINEKFYLLSGFNIFYGVQKSRLDNIECTVNDFDNDVEFLIEHVRLNKNPIAFNPLKLFPLIDYLKTKSISSDQIPELLQIHKTPHEDIINLILSSDAISELSNIFIYLSQNVTNPTMPFFAMKLVANCDESKQKDAAILLKELINTTRVNDSKFNWPSHEEIKLRLNNTDFFQEQHKSVIVSPKGDVPSKSSLKDSENMITLVKDSIIIPATDLHPQIFVDKKTESVKFVDEKNSIIKLEEHDKQPVYALSRKVTDNLDFENITSVKVLTFKSTDKVHRFLDSHPNIKGVLMYNET